MTRAESGRVPRRVATISTMGTVVSVDLRAPGPLDTDGAIEAVTDRLNAIDVAFSPWRPGSWVSRLIQGSVSVGDCPADVRQVAAMALQLMELTDGYFSPFWRRAERPGAGPDPTGLVKGWAAQQASDVLLAHGLPHHVVNAAGDLVVSGEPGSGPAPRTWRVGIADPGRPGRLAGAVELGAGPARWAVATSGTAELGAHVCDPHTAAHPDVVGSATVVLRLDEFEEGGAVADAGATALVAAGERSGPLLAALGTAGVGAFVIEVDGTVHDPASLLVPV